MLDDPLGGACTFERRSEGTGAVDEGTVESESGGERWTRHAGSGDEVRGRVLQESANVCSPVDSPARADGGE